MLPETTAVLKSVSARKIADISRWLPQAWYGEIQNGKLLLPQEINSALLSRMVYVLGTLSGYFIIYPDEFMAQESSPGKCVPFPCPRNHEPHAYGIGMTELTEDGCLTLAREIRDAPEFQDPNIVFVERHSFIEVWSMAAWDLAMDV